MRYMENKLNRACIFAHYDKDGIIDDYVLYYLKALKEVCTRIIFVSDCDLIEGEDEKLKDLVSHIISGRHGEYDFGSYKRGYQLVFDELNQYDELIFCNDSCYCLGNFKTIFKKMDKKTCDFWGLTYGSRSNKIHLQSYFVAIRNYVFIDSKFTNFLSSISREKNKEDIINKYEIGMTNEISSWGYSHCAFINKIFKTNPTLSFPFLLLRKKVPLFKKENLIENRCNHASLHNISRWTTQQVYNIIIKHAKRCNSEFKIASYRQVTYKSFVNVIYKCLKRKKLMFYGER